MSAIKRPKDTIETLEELQNIIVLGLDVWYVSYDSGIHHLRGLKLLPGKCGLCLHSSGRTPMYIQFVGIRDKTFDSSLKMSSNIYGFLFNDEKAARSFSMEAFRNFAINGPLDGPS